ncbi:hypothetical protein K3N28_14945 [Glycomyces sp. TRM65418]|uniref:hypothetical protein n=1 Tax=Glycomyces sp. TRM65418 TaxID=2867006 RepID=UPI001CE55B3C|nr:hypothetical protein [Glycomyces sp. TRM65418]MCC3764361.1 hypothetical protein [Glycomyces sp. TRM65418]QZD54040.1 hypothetical protein K3N28_14870 [Glycomyces sp. TRM65418]
MHPVIAALAAKKFLAVAGTGLMGLTGLTACTAADSSDDSGTETAAEETTEAAPVVIECDYVPAEADPEAGQSIDAPLDMCATGKVDTWDIAVTAVEVDATDTILAADATNEAPAEGSQYFMITVTGANRADAAAAPTDLLIGVRNGSWTYQSDCGIVPNDVLEVGEVAPGESFTANRCVPIETEKIEGAVIEMALLNSWDVETYTYYASA